MNYSRRLLSRCRQVVAQRCLSTSSNIGFFQRQQQWQQHRQQRGSRIMSSWEGHGTDLLNDSLAHNDGVPKIILKGYSQSGFDVLNMIKNKDPTDESLQQTGGIVHCAGSIIALPSACFLWKVRDPKDLTLESLAPILLHRPKLEYLFLGSKEPLPQELIKSIRDELRKDAPGLVVEALDVSNAMGTFNVLNGEDRRVAAAFILPPDEDE
mmetsp:Transcript_16720/g.45845  ORF Transcript_16720/g.45845 Transcript_16720/m.45845 type:complete len:210 (+) Transcript_16720:192-821(+)